MLHILLVSVLCSGNLLANAQCTTPGCRSSSAGTDVTTERILEDHDHRLHDIYQNLLEKIERNDERFRSLFQQVTEVYLKAKYKVCPPGFRYLPKADGCFKVIFRKLNWTEAGNECRRLIPGAHLSAITSARKQEAVTEYLSNEFNETDSSACLFKDGAHWNEGQLTVWTSGQTRVPDQCGTPYEWKVLDGMKIPFEYKNWIILEPSCGHTNEHCVQMVAGSNFNFEWNDLNCGRKTCALCEL